MGIPVTPPPPRRDGESLEEYIVRCEPWRRMTLGAATASRQAFRQALVFVVVVLVLCVVILLVRRW